MTLRPCLASASLKGCDLFCTATLTFSSTITALRDSCVCPSQFSEDWTSYIGLNHYSCASRSPVYSRNLHFGSHGSDKSLLSRVDLQYSQDCFRTNQGDLLSNLYFLRPTVFLHNWDWLCNYRFQIRSRRQGLLANLIYVTRWRRVCLVAMALRISSGSCPGISQVLCAYFPALPQCLWVVWKILLLWRHSSDSPFRIQ